MKKKRFLFILILLIVFVCMPVYADDTASGVTCQSMLGDLLFQIKQVYGYVRIVVPVLLILLTSLDFAKVVLSDSKDGMDKAKSNFLKRAIAALIIFFAPNILELIAYVIDGPSEIAACLDELENAQPGEGSRPQSGGNSQPKIRDEDKELVEAQDDPSSIEYLVKSRPYITCGNGSLSFVMGIGESEDLECRSTDVDGKFLYTIADLNILQWDFYPDNNTISDEVNQNENFSSQFNRVGKGDTYIEVKFIPNDRNKWEVHTITVYVNDN